MPKHVRIDSCGELLEFANSLVEGAVREAMSVVPLDEEEQAGAEAAGIFDDGNQAQQQQQKPQQPNPYAAKQHPQEDLEKPTIDMVVDKLNAIRSGRSFRDSSVQGSMEQYFNKLSEEERSALLTFLKGISQIVTGEIQGQQAVDPNDSAPGPSIKMSKSGEEKGRKVKNVTVVKSPKHAGGAPAKGAEDNSAPLPVKPRMKA